MTEQTIDSAAFQKVLLQSERHRILGVVAFITLFTGIVVLRILVYGSQMSPWGVVALVLLVAYEFAMLRIVDQCLREDKKLPSGLWPGDLLLLITDGFFEWENSSQEQFGFDRLADMIRTHCHLPLEEIIAEIYHSVLAFAGGTKQRATPPVNFPSIT